MKKPAKSPLLHCALALFALIGTACQQESDVDTVKSECAARFGILPGGALSDDAHACLYGMGTVGPAAQDSLVASRMCQDMYDVPAYKESLQQRYAESYAEAIKAGRNEESARSLAKDDVEIATRMYGTEEALGDKYNACIAGANLHLASIEKP